MSLSKQGTNVGRGLLRILGGRLLADSSVQVRPTTEYAMARRLKPYRRSKSIDIPLSACLQNPIKNVVRPSYLDNQATTPLDPRVLDKMLPYMVSLFGNPHSRTHVYGWEVEEAVDEGRAELGKLINAGRPQTEIIWTSGATESNNLIVKGIVQYRMAQKDPKDPPLHIITTEVEHKCVLASCRDLEVAYPGQLEVTYLPVDEDGVVDPKQLAKAIRPETCLVTVMMVNNEIGTIQPMKQIGEICQAHPQVIFHSDIAQAAGKVPVDVQDIGIHAASLSGHKFYGPKGVGALYIDSKRRPRIRVFAQMSGGGQERGIRSGTVPSWLSIGMGEAARIAREELPRDLSWTKHLADRAMNALSKMPKIVLNGSKDDRYSGNLNVSFDGVEGESLIMALKEVAAVSSGSACTSTSLEPSYVLRAMGIDDDLAHTSLRLGFSRFTTEEEVDLVCGALEEAVVKLRDMSAVWELKQDGKGLDGLEWT